MYLIRYIKTCLIEEEESEESGFIEKDNYAYDDGTKIVKDVNEIRSWVKDQVMYQTSDKNKKEYSYIDYSYIDTKEGSIVTGIVITNTIYKEITKKIIEENDQEEEEERDLVLSTIETSTTWVDIHKLEMLSSDEIQDIKDGINL